MKKQTNPDEATEQFLQRMREETGVSWRFLNSARPLVRRAFTHVPEEERESCLAGVKRAFARQAEIERLTEEAKQALEQAKRKTPTYNTDLFGVQHSQLLS